MAIELVGPAPSSWTTSLTSPLDATVQPISPARALGIPALARVVGLIAGLTSQMPLREWRGDQPITPAARVLQRPDPEHTLPWFITESVTDYLIHGNAIAYITSRNAEGYPQSVQWIPAGWVSMTWNRDDQAVEYRVGTQVMAAERVIHVQRGADPAWPWRGIGIVEQHMDSLSTAVDQSTYERSVLRSAAVPSVAVITPNAEVSQEAADAAKESWVTKYGGAKREPGIFPKGTEVVPLSWSPADSELIAARQLALVDMGNLANIDGYWLGAPAGSFTYRSPAPMYLNLVRQTLGPIIAEFEAVWSWSLLPRGRDARFWRQTILGDDMGTTIGWLDTAIRGRILTKSEARVILGYSAEVPAELEEPPAEQSPTPADMMGPPTEEKTK